MTFLMAAAWWFAIQGPAVTPADRATVTSVQMVGPFVSQEACRVRGRAMIPTDRRFWTAAEVAEAEARDRATRETQERQKQENAAKRAAAIAAFLKFSPRGGWLSLDDELIFIGPGVNEEWRRPLTGDSGSPAAAGAATVAPNSSQRPEVKALSGCQEIKE